MSIPVTLSYMDSEGKQHLAPGISAARCGYLDIIDQTLLPREQKRLKLETPEAVYEAIKQLRVRGAPAIGCSAAIGLAVCAQADQRLRLSGKGNLLHLAGMRCHQFGENGYQGSQILLCVKFDKFSAADIVHGRTLLGYAG